MYIVICKFDKDDFHQFGDLKDAHLNNKKMYATLILEIAILTISTRSKSDIKTIVSNARAL